MAYRLNVRHDIIKLLEETMGQTFSDINCTNVLLGQAIEIKTKTGTFLGVQWLRIRLPMQGKQVWALIQEDPTCRGATKPVHHNYWAWTLELMSHNYWGHKTQLLKPACLEPMLCNKRSHCNEKPVHCNEEQSPLAATRESPYSNKDPTQTKKLINKLKKKKEKETNRT